MAATSCTVLQTNYRGGLHKEGPGKVDLSFHREGPGKVDLSLHREGPGKVDLSLHREGPGNHSIGRDLVKWT